MVDCGLSPVDGNRRMVGTGRVRRAVTLLLAVVMLVFGGLFASSVVRAHDGSGSVDAAEVSTSNDNFFNNIVCGTDLGWNTRYAWFQVPAFDDGLYATKWSIKDLYGSSLNWTVYNGTKSPKSLNEGKIFPDSHKVDDSVKADMVDAANEVHSFGKCLGNGIGSLFAGMLLQISNLVSSVSSFFVTQAVNPGIICPTAQGGSGCINLLKVLAGDGLSGGSTGIIGHLYSGLYLGLLSLAFACVGIWMLYTGIMKYKTRTALSGFLWALGIMFIGCMIGGNPMLIAQAPMKLGTGLGGCAIMAMNGVNCLDTNSMATATNGKRTECYVDSAGTVDWDSSMALIAKQSTCDIWRAFVLQPWALGQFGRSYDELYYDGTDTPSNDNTDILTKLPDDVKDKIQADWKDIRVSLSSANGGTNPMTVCKNANDADLSYQNIALYQLDLMSSLHDCTGYQETTYNWVPLSAANRGDIAKHSSAKLNGDPFTYADWVYLIELMSANRATAGSGDDDNSAVWYWWSGQNAGSRFQVSLASVFCSFAGAAILITTSVLAIVYLFTSVVMTVFAPLFLLFGIVPGQGKRIFLGYVEELVSAVLKYFACILYMMVVVEIYGAVLGTDMSLGSTIMFVTIFTIALWSYRKVFINMIGKANLGGQKLSDTIGGGLDKKHRARHLAQRAAAVGSAAVGGFVAAKAMGDATGSTMRDSVMDELGRSNSVVGATARAHQGMRRNETQHALQEMQVASQDAAKARDTVAEHIDKAYGADVSKLHDKQDVIDFVDDKHHDEMDALDNKRRTMDDLMDTKVDAMQQLHKERMDANTTDERKKQIDDYYQYDALQQKLRNGKDLTDEQREEIKQQMSGFADGHSAISKEITDKLEQTAAKNNYDLANDKDAQEAVEMLATRTDGSAYGKAEAIRDDASDKKRKLNDAMDKEKRGLYNSMRVYEQADKAHKIAENNAEALKEHSSEYSTKELRRIRSEASASAETSRNALHDIENRYDGTKNDAQDARNHAQGDSLENLNKAQRRIMDMDDDGHTIKDHAADHRDMNRRRKPITRHRNTIDHDKFDGNY